MDLGGWVLRRGSSRVAAPTIHVLATTLLKVPQMPSKPPHSGDVVLFLLCRPRRKLQARLEAIKGGLVASAAHRINTSVSGLTSAHPSRPLVPCGRLHESMEHTTLRVERPMAYATCPGVAVQGAGAFDKHGWSPLPRAEGGRKDTSGLLCPSLLVGDIADDNHTKLPYGGVGGGWRHHLRPPGKRGGTAGAALPRGPPIHWG